ncbi:hypothetical protein PV11_04092 [Exophiala sideris]|uniref:Zn(2)-C6 fungal-type domain-containing protein n=1 Tax=Exophiala sideris TaxID=1016849 RepID=A0A0D1VZU1_9EURO|nr:hypothetical protein PV11_04092 [Exophiala sideris]
MRAEESPRPTNPLKRPRPRQDPVSCEFCRSKKLKCDRQQPCANCATRGLSCNGQSGRPPLNTQPSSDGDTASVLARLKRLEDIVIGPSSHGSPAIVGLRQSPQLAYLSPASEYEEAVHTLEESGTRRENWLSPASDDIEFRTLPGHDIAHTIGISFGHSTKSPHLPSASKSVLLPVKDEASILLDFYFRYLSGLQHVLCESMVREITDTLYSHLEQGLPILHGHAALLLTIFACSTTLCSYQTGEMSRLYFQAVASQASLVWVKSALDLLESSRRTTQGTLEDIQGTILMTFFLYHFEGFSARVRRLFAAALVTARELGLHKLDAVASSRHADPTEIEIKRRVWWHLVATDWFVALSGGPQEGTYLIQPRQFRVNMLRNVDDRDLNQVPPVDLPQSQPTIMSYYIQRVKLGSICRSVVDVMPLSSIDLATLDYQEVILLDSKFQAFFDELPMFFRTDENSRRQTEHIVRQYPHISTQRCMLNMVARTRRCKVHQPFLIRRSVESHYAYSRDISLESARCVIRLMRLFQRETDTAFSSNFKLVRMTCVVHHIFMATIVLVMDLCFNKSEDDTERKAEVMEACKIMEETACQSPLAKGFIDSLMGVLRKHKVRLHNLSGDVVDTPSSLNTTAHSGPPNVVDTMTVPEIQPLSNSYLPQDNTQSYSSDFDEIWKDYVELGPNMDMPGWDSLFSDLDSRL